MDALRLSLIQTHLHWENPQANHAMLEEKISPLRGETDVILLPEMFPTGFTMNAAAHAESMGLQTFRWMRMTADQTGALVLGSFIAKENEHFYNRLLWMEPGGNFQVYDKRHLFRMADEHATYAPGAQRLTGTWKGWRICPLICYDLRFPVWSRNQMDNSSKRMDYDLLVYVANWPQPRVSQWRSLLPARAIENLAYVAGVNRTGPDGHGVVYNGQSLVSGPRGEVLWSAGEEETIGTIALDGNALHQYRDRFPAWMDADRFQID